MGILSGNQKDEPMHYGEVYYTWMHLTTAKACIASYETLINHIGDEDLKKLMVDVVENGTKPEIDEIEKLLKENGVGLPPTPPERPKASLESIPPGARFLDPEIANMLAVDLGAGLVSCSTVMSQCIREDIAMMYGQFHLQKAQYAAKALRLLKEKGWLIPPPLHVNTAVEC